MKQWRAPTGRPTRGRRARSPVVTLVAQPSLLIVDDDRLTRGLLEHVLCEGEYECATAASVSEARDLLRQREFQLVLTDMTMPGDTGLDLIGYIRDNYPNVAVVMVTGHDDPDLARLALDIGAYGYVIKPFTPNEIAIAVANALRRRELEIAFRTQAVRLEQAVAQRTAELKAALEDLKRADEEVRRSREDTINRLAMAAEFRDVHTAQHVARMSRYCALLYRLAGQPTERAELVRVASLMHDVGKIGVPDEILFKPGALTPEEWDTMRKHTEFGHQILSGSGSELLDAAAMIALTHHERVDGAGYPHGLSGDEIPIEGRIAAVADVFDALTSDRVYRPAMSLTEARAIIEEGRGTHFDAGLVDLMMEGWDDVVTIHLETQVA